MPKFHQFSISRGSRKGSPKLPERALASDHVPGIFVYYFTSDRFMRIGTLDVRDGKFIGDEGIKGKADGITEVRSVIELVPNKAARHRCQLTKSKSRFRMAVIIGAAVLIQAQLGIAGQA